MVLHVRYTGDQLWYKGREGIVLQKDQVHSQVLFIRPYNVPYAITGVRNDELETIKPALAYPPVKRRFCQMGHYTWDLHEAWQLITEDRPKMTMPVDKVRDWHEGWMDQIEFRSRTTVIHKARSDTFREALDRIALSSTIDLTKPLLAAQIRPLRGDVPEGLPNLVIIDGWDRLHKAFVAGEPLFVYPLIPAEESYLRGSYVPTRQQPEQQGVSHG